MVVPYALASKIEEERNTLDALSNAGMSAQMDDLRTIAGLQKVLEIADRERREAIAQEIITAKRADENAAELAEAKEYRDELKEEDEELLREICLECGFDPSEGEGTSIRNVHSAVKFHFNDLREQNAALKARVERLEGALKPFAELADKLQLTPHYRPLVIGGNFTERDGISSRGITSGLKAGDFYAAEIALAETPDPKSEGGAA